MNKMLTAILALSVSVLSLYADTPSKRPTYIQVKAAQEDAFMKDYADVLSRCRFFSLATVYKGKPHVRPIGVTAIIDNCMVVGTSSAKEMYTHMMANPSVDCSATTTDFTTFLRFSGQATLCKDSAVFNTFTEKFPLFRRLFGDKLVLFMLKPDRAGIFSMRGKKPITKTFTDGQN